MMLGPKAALALVLETTTTIESAATEGDEPRRGKVGVVSWETSGECPDLLEKARVSDTELAACTRPIHVTVRLEEGGYVGRQHWEGEDGPLEQTNQPRPNCDDALEVVAVQARVHCEIGGWPPQEPEAPPTIPSVFGITPGIVEQEPPHPYASGETPAEVATDVEPVAVSTTPMPLVFGVELIMLGGFGRDSQALARGILGEVGYSQNRLRAMVFAAREQFYHPGRRGAGVDGYVMPLPSFSHGGVRACMVLAGNEIGRQRVLDMPACISVGMGQIRGGRAGHGEMWGGIDGSLRAVVRLRGPVSFRAGADLVVSLFDDVIRPSSFHERGDVAFRLGGGIELRPRLLSGKKTHTTRKARGEWRERRRRERHARSPWQGDAT